MKSARILITDDEPNIRLMLRTALESEYGVSEAADGQQALEEIDRDVPDLLLLDLSMPVLDGMAVLEKLRDRPLESRPRVVVLTAYGSIPASVKAMRLGARDFLEKPITPEDLRHGVAAALAEPAETEPRTSLDLSYSQLLQQVRKDLFTGDFPHAEALLMKAAELAGTDPAYFNLLGILHEAEGRKEVARKFYGKAIHADPKYEAAQQNMRRLYELQTFGSTKQEVALGDEVERGSTTTADVENRIRALMDRPRRCHGWFK